MLLQTQQTVVLYSWSIILLRNSIFAQLRKVLSQFSLSRLEHTINLVNQKCDNLDVFSSLKS